MVAGKIVAHLLPHRAVFHRKFSRFGKLITWLKKGNIGPHGAFTASKCAQVRFLENQTGNLCDQQTNSNGSLLISGYETQLLDRAPWLDWMARIRAAIMWSCPPLPNCIIRLSYFHLHLKSYPPGNESAYLLILKWQMHFSSVYIQISKL